MITILDCYTDEPAGLGVPPYLGTYPRYIAGKYIQEGEEVRYLTIDDLRSYAKSIKQRQPHSVHNKQPVKTNIYTYNLTKNSEQVEQILRQTSQLIIIAGIHTPGKYLSAVPGELKEIISLLRKLKLNCETVLTGPCVYGTSLQGGKFAEKTNLKFFNKVIDFKFSYDDIASYSIHGSRILEQIPDLRILEIETSKGCSRKKGCSFCTEPIKNKLEFRKKKDIVAEVKALHDSGIKHFRLGKQSCFYSHPKAIDILKGIRKECKNIDVLHIDNVNPANVITKRGKDITKAITKYCTEGNIASFGVESFNKKVIEANSLNSTPEQVVEAVKIINKYGAKRGDNGMPIFLPGINLLFGLINESKETHEQNLFWLKKILDSDLLLRRINIRQVNVFKGTPLYKSVGNKFLRKNKKYYWSWRKQIRTEIDYPMLKKLVPAGTVIKHVRTEVHDGNATFGRQIGTYPLIVGVKQRLELNKFISIKVKDHMLRSIVGELHP